MSSKEKEVEDHSLCAIVSVNEGLPFAVPSVNDGFYPLGHSERSEESQEDSSLCSEGFFTSFRIMGWGKAE
jgi:hypothetical protein